MKKVQEKELKWVKPLALRRINMYKKAQEQEIAPEKLSGAENFFEFHNEKPEGLK